MPDFTPQNPGDVPYPQYSVTTTERISDALQIIKGIVYTKNAAGLLVAVTTTLDNGIYQAAASPLLPAVAANDDEVQCLGPRTRMIFVDTVGSLVPGEDVIAVANTLLIVTGAKTSPLYIGKVFEIYSVNADSTRKIISGVGDKIVVETVQA